MRTPYFIPLLLILLVSCAPAKTPFTLTFAPHWDGNAIECTGDSTQLTDLRFYVSALQLIDSDGSVIDAELENDGEWQNSDVALIDLEDGRGACVNGSTATRAFVQATAANGEYLRLAFTVGVPFEQNHANPMSAAAPLDDAAMHWHWRSGYKFLRAGFRNADRSFWMHLGSTGCEGTVQNISMCNAANRVVVEVPLESLKNLEIGIDLARLFATADGSDCSSGPAESACAQPFKALGLTHQDSVSDVQTVFALLP